ncbi:hypothetical protein [Haloplanus halophilus]|uniref:hypothetical protein n=1 Tax=Haloplanus halophilus TaxID=2949993 RepID=UPI00203CDBAB|nr:hypothetical protein [Haloplanus sp. GDY1]
MNEVGGRGDGDPLDAGATHHCYAGEDVVAEAPLGAGWAAVTTHRVLAYNPAADGRRFEAVDRPNVSSVSVDAAGDRRLLGWGLRALLYGLAGVGGGGVLRATNLVGTLSMEAGATGAAPVGSVLAVTDALAAALATLATLLLVGGLALVAASLGLFGQYLRTRQPALVVERFGDDPVRLSAPRADGERAARSLSGALEER